MVVEHGSPRVAERIVDVLVPPIMEEIVKVVTTVLQERISVRICKQIVDVFVSTGCRASLLKSAQELKPRPKLTGYSWSRFHE